MTIEEITSQRDSLLEALRQYSRDQAELWSQIPYLALMAQGRTGFSDNYYRAMHIGAWPVQQLHGSYTVYVDLATGDLVSTLDPSKLARDDQIVGILTDLEQLDAEALADSMRRDALKPINEFVWKHRGGEDGYLEWREGERVGSHLTPHYARRQAIPKARFCID
jgi:hypothetical protein